MSSIFALSDEGRRAKDEQAALNPLSLEQAGTNLFTGTGREVGNAPFRFFAKAGETIGLAASVPFIAFDKLAGTESADYVFKAIDNYGQPAVDYWTPNPKTTGTGAKVLGGLTETLTGLAVTGGKPMVALPTIAAEQSIPVGIDLVKQGVSPGAAAAVSTVHAATAGAGFVMPFLGNTLTSRVLSGAAGNLLLNRSSDLAAQQILKSTGNEEAAKNYDPFTAQKAWTDILTGVAFGGFAHLTHQPNTPRVLPSEVDAALTINNAKHFQHDTAPGDPADIESSVAHQDAMGSAMTDMLKGDPVNVENSGVHEAHFVPREPVPPMEIPKEFQVDVPHEPVEHIVMEGADHQVLDAANHAQDAYTVHEGEMTHEQLKAFQGLRSNIPSNENVGGTRQRASEQQGRSSDGGQGSQANQPLPVFRGADTPLTAGHFSDSALGYATGHPTSGLGVFFTNDHGDAARYGSMVERAYLDIRKPKVIKFEDLPSFETQAEYAKFRKKLEKQGYDGIVLDATHLDGPVQYVAFHPDQVVNLRNAAHEARPVSRPEQTKPTTTKPAATSGEAVRSEGVRSATDTGSSGSPEQGVNAERLVPEISAAHQALAEIDVQMPTGEIDADGNPKTVSARELLAQAQADVKRAQTDANAFSAAINCYLVNGAT